MQEIESWKHLGDILGRHGKILGPSWVPMTPPGCAKISQNRAQEPPQSRLEGVRCVKTAPRCLKMPPRPPKRPPRRAKRAPRAPKTPSGSRKSFQNGQGYLRYAAFLNPPEIPINWRGGTKAQPSSIRRRSAERRARCGRPNFCPQSILPSIFVPQTRLSSKLLAT